jgi:hypothetical protein
MAPPARAPPGRPVAAPPIKAPASPPSTAPLAAFCCSGVWQPASEAAMAKAAARGIIFFIFSNSESVALDWNCGALRNGLAFKKGLTLNKRSGWFCRDFSRLASQGAHF